ncbi:MAG TPA: tetratricopeptide repeat protein [Dongiaceae bacterium]
MLSAIPRCASTGPADRRCYRPSRPSDLKAGSFYRLGHLERDQRRWPEAKEAYGQALTIVRAAPQADDLEYRILDGLAAAQRESGELDEAEQTLQTSIKLANGKQDLPALANSYNSLGLLLQARRDTQPALAAFERSIALFDQLKARFQQAQVFNNLGLAYADMAQWEKSRDYLERCLEIGPIRWARPRPSATWCASTSR